MALEVKLGQDLRLRQQLVMTPQLQQAIKILQLSLPELEAIVQSELEQNPMLEPLDQSPAEAASESEVSDPEAAAPADGEPLPPESDGLNGNNSDDDWETGSREEKPASTIEVEARDAALRSKSSTISKSSTGASISRPTRTTGRKPRRPTTTMTIAARSKTRRCAAVRSKTT